LTSDEGSGAKGRALTSWSGARSTADASQVSTESFAAAHL
jgi:hypothetical protein